MAAREENTMAQTALDDDLVKVSVLGINGEWLEDLPKLGDTVRLEVTAYVKATGEEQLEEGDGARRRQTAKLKVNGVRVLK
jgi:hypothetical protein